MNQLLQTLVSTVVQGSVLALITIGMTLVYGTLRVLNMAQGVMVMVGGVAAYAFLQSTGWPVWTSLIAGGARHVLVGRPGLLRSRFFRSLADPASTSR